MTNGNADIFRFGIGKYFSFSVSSLEAKNSKPNRAHFDKAIKIMGDIKIDEILHIGDHQVNDILAAYDLGIESLWFNNFLRNRDLDQIPNPKEEIPKLEKKVRLLGNIGLGFLTK